MLSQQSRREGTTKHLQHAESLHAVILRMTMLFGEFLVSYERSSISHHELTLEWLFVLQFSLRAPRPQRVWRDFGQSKLGFVPL